jgi:hypothetical protein
LSGVPKRGGCDFGLVVEEFGEIPLGNSESFVEQVRLAILAISGDSPLLLA